MRELAEGAYFKLCLASGRVLRSTRYSTVRVVHRDGQREVQKRRLFYAPLLIWMAALLTKILDTGVRVLPQRDWEERERRIYRSLRASSIRIDADRVLVLPRLAGHTLASLLADPSVQQPLRMTALEHATVALADFHRLGFTHGDAMAENVLVDLTAGVARWFDFETVHDAARSPVWRRADDVRALLVTSIVRTAPERHAETLDVILGKYADHDVIRAVAASFTTAWRRSLTFHLAQAPLSSQSFREIGRLLRERLQE